MGNPTAETSYQKAVSEIVALAENNATLYEAIDYLRQFVAAQINP